VFGFKIILSPRAQKDFDEFEEKIFQKIVSSIKTLEEHPFPQGKLIKKLKGTKTVFYRLRADKYRVYYTIKNREVVILRVLSKKDAKKFIKNL
jgi:mRNA interferase RelE/StbE